MRITKMVTVTIERREIVGMLIDVLSQGARSSTGKQSTTYRALSHLPFSSDVEAVKWANRWADEYSHPRVKVAEFRRWLPSVLSEIFAEYMGETREHDPR